MKSLIFHNADNSVRVEYKCDLMDGANNFTVLDIRGLSAAEEVLGLTFKRLPYNLTAFKAFATTNSLTLELVTTSAVTVLVA